MSRTDKTTPFWVRAEWYEPVHSCRQHHTRGWFATDCDLPAEPVRHGWIRSAWRHPECTTRCTWEPLWTHDERHPHGAAPKWFRDHVWTLPNRTRQRSEMARARKEWNGSGDTDVIPNVDQHRHCAGWLYW